MAHEKEQLETSGEIKVATKGKLNLNFSWILSEWCVCSYKNFHGFGWGDYIHTLQSGALKRQSILERT